MLTVGWKLLRQHPLGSSAAQPRVVGIVAAVGGADAQAGRTHVGAAHPLGVRERSVAQGRAHLR